MKNNIIVNLLVLLVGIIITVAYFKACSPEPPEPTVVETIHIDTISTTTIDTIYIPQDRVVYRNLFIPTPAETLFVRPDTDISSPALSYNLTHKDSLIDASVNIITEGALLDWTFEYTPSFPTIIRTDSITITNTITREITNRPSLITLGLSAEGSYSHGTSEVDVRAALFVGLRIGSAEITYLPTLSITEGSFLHILKTTYTIR